MIYINRHRNDEKDNPIRPSDQWFIDAETATQVALAEKENHNADAGIYGHNLIRAALEKLFHDKCAYCESKISGITDWNVEHFRPKGRVAERADHPGYYWLAYKWDNLYPSCTFCNQRRKDKPRWGDLRYADASGKMDQFPLENEGTRAMSHDSDLSQELHLLLDPCRDNPEDYFTYDVLGKIDAIKNDSRAHATIKICNLKQRRLSDRRREKIIAVTKLMKILKKFERDEDHTAVDEIKMWLTEHLLADNCPHAGAARAVVADPDAFGV